MNRLGVDIKEELSTPKCADQQQSDAQYCSPTPIPTRCPNPTMQIPQNILTCRPVGVSCKHSDRYAWIAAGHADKHGTRTHIREVWLVTWSTGAILVSRNRWKRRNVSPYDNVFMVAEGSQNVPAESRRGLTA